MLTLDVLVIGAGLSGLTAASALQKKGVKVACVDKARGSGGRMSSKRVETGKTGDMLSFDLGCPYFDAKTSIFQNQLNEWERDGVVAAWGETETGQTLYVATPRSSSLTRYLSESLEMHFATRVTRLERIDGSWQAWVGEGEQQVPFARCNSVVFAIPPQQAADLLAPSHPFKAHLSQHILLPQWVLMVNVKGHLNLTGERYYFADSIISRLVLDNSKPQRNESSDHQCWVILADTQWSSETMDSDKAWVEKKLIAELAHLVGTPVIMEDRYLHRWLYSVAGPNSLTGRDYLKDDAGLWFCGDYLADTTYLGGVEAAFTSGCALAENFHLE